MSHSSTDVLSAGVDTLTCSAERDRNGAHLMELAKSLQLAEARHGSKLSPFHRAVYSGVQSQHVAWGEKKDRVLVELRGRWAYDWWESVVSLADKVSRIDVQVSVRQQPYDHEMALRLYLADRKAAQQRGRPPKMKLIGESDGGTTLYIGRGASRYQARMYERFFKSKQEEDKDVWRYEVQSRRERAQQMADVGRRAGDIQPFVQAVVHSHFKRRGVVPIFHPAADVSMAPLPNPTSDKQKSLRWLGSSVAPAIARHREWGSYDEAIAALALDDS